MKRIAVLSTSNHPGYFYFVPIVEYYWNKFGWDVALFVTPDAEGYKTFSETTTVHIIPEIEGVRPGTCAQTVRHFVSNVLPKDAYIMVQDIDLIPLRAWNPDLNARTVWGYPEMTGGAFVPVHYTGMTGDKWFDLMDCTGDLKADMEREMKANGRAYGKDWEQYWDTDWDILTKKVLAKKDQFTFVPRQMVNGLPYGRVDRSTIQVSPIDNSYSWGSSFNQSEYIDAHCEWHNSSSPEKWKNIRALLIKIFGEVPEWMNQHAKEHYEKYGLR